MIPIVGTYCRTAKDQNPQRGYFVHMTNAQIAPDKVGLYEILEEVGQSLCQHETLELYAGPKRTFVSPEQMQVLELFAFEGDLERLCDEHVSIRSRMC